MISTAAVVLSWLGVNFFLIKPTGLDTPLSAFLWGIPFLASLTSMIYVLLIQLRRKPGRRLRDFAIFLAWLLQFVPTFSLTYARCAHSFTNMNGRIGAVYFTLTTLTTVGFGDITPASRSARLLVRVQMIYDLGL